MSVTLALFEKIWFPMHTNICPVGYSVYFLLFLFILYYIYIYIFIKYLFICEKYFVI